MSISPFGHSPSPDFTQKTGLGEKGESSSGPKQYHKAVAEKNEALLDWFTYPGISQPLLARQGPKLLQEATWNYIQADHPDRRIDAALWIKQLLGKGNVDLEKPASEIPVFNLAINSREPWLVKLFQKFKASISPPEVLTKAREKLSEIVGEENPEVRDNLLKQNQALFFLPGLDLTQPLPLENAQQTFLHIAARDDELALLKPLLQSAVPPDLTAGNTTPLEEAVRENSIMAGEELIKAGANMNRLNREGHTPLMQALQSYHNGFAQMLLRNGADPNIPNQMGITPLHLAAGNSFGNTGDLLNELLKAGANVNAQNQYGSAPLHEASRRGQANAVSQLLQAGADVSLTDNKGRNAIFHAAGRIGLNAPQILKELLAYGANPDQPSHNGETPLLYAIKKRRKENVGALVEGAQAHGKLNAANINLPGKNNQKPLKLAQDLALRDILLPEVIQRERGHNDSGLVRMRNRNPLVIRKREHAIREMIRTMSGTAQNREWLRRVKNEDEIVQHLTRMRKP